MKNNINQKDNKVSKKRLVGQIILTSIFGIIIIGVSLAFFFAKTSGSLETITTKKLVDITYTDDSTLRLTNNVPIYESEIEDSATEFNFTVTNPNTSAVYATIDLTDIIMSDALQNYDFKWALYDGNTKLTIGTFINGGTTVNLYNNSKIDANSSKNYKIRLWIEETGETQNFNETSFTSNVKVTAYSKQLKTLTSKILGKNNANVITLEPTFSTTSTDKGIFVQNSDSTKSNYGFSTYYYRGAIENNYVQLGTYKSNVTNDVYDPSSDSVSKKVVAQAGEAILWRIVRINEDGSIRLIAEYNIGLSVKYDSTSSNYTGSNAETEVNNWYNTNIAVDSNTDNLVITGNYCNDISDSYNAVNTRMTNKTPIFTCPSGANIINSKVGLISSDEMMYAGTLWSQSVVNNTTYLNNNTEFWTISPSWTNYVFAWFNHPSLVQLHEHDVNQSHGVRPVINLSSDVIAISGTGTKSDPYIIKTN